MSYLDSRTFGALRLLARAMHRMHGDLNPDAVADLARLTLSRDITAAAVIRACGVCGISINR